MPELVIWRRQKISKMRKDMDRMMERVLGDFRPATCPGLVLTKPQYELLETETELILKADIPGANPDDIEIDITDNVLTIQGELAEETLSEDESHQWIEKKYRTFSKSIPLPRRIILSRVKATYKKGVLNVVMPKYSGKEKRGIRVRLR